MKGFINKLILVFSLCIILVGITLYKDSRANNFMDLLNKFNDSTTKLESANEYIRDNINNKLNISKICYPVPNKYSGYITSTQGLRESIKNVNSGGGVSMNAYHNAIDFACPEGTPIYSVNDGYVTEVYPGFYNGRIYKGHPTYGGLIVIKHEDGTTTLYAHLSKTLVREGVYVTKGQHIGDSGGVKGKRASGNSTGPHLHFAMYVDILDLFQ